MFCNITHCCQTYVPAQRCSALNNLMALSCLTVREQRSCLILYSKVCPVNVYSHIDVKCVIN